MLEKRPLRLAIVGGELAARHLLSTALQTYDDFRVRRCRDVCELLASASLQRPTRGYCGVPGTSQAGTRHKAPEIVVLNAAGEGSLAAQVARVCSAVPEVCVLICSEDSSGASILSALRAGAAGYLVMPVSPERVAEAARAARSGEYPLSPLAATRLIERLRRPTSRRAPSQLSEREREVFRLLVRGLRYRDIAGRLFISLETVRSHVRKIYRKLAVTSRAELAARWFSSASSLEEQPSWR